MKFNRRTALKSMLAPLVCLIPQIAKPKSKSVGQTWNHKPEFAKNMLFVDGGSVSDSHFKFDHAALLEHLPLWQDEDAYPGAVVKVPCGSGMSDITWGNQTYTVPYEDFETWILCDGRWFLAHERYVPESWQRHHPDVWNDYAFTTREMSLTQDQLNAQMSHRLTTVKRVMKR